MKLTGMDNDPTGSNRWLKPSVIPNNPLASQPDAIALLLGHLARGSTGAFMLYWRVN